MRVPVKNHETFNSRLNKLVNVCSCNGQPNDDDVSRVTVLGYTRYHGFAKLGQVSPLPVLI